MEKSGELIFLRYAFPVIGYCNRETITAQEILEFERMLKEGNVPNRKRLEELFPEAVNHLKSWSPKDIRDYWLREHNMIVSENPLCKVYAVEVQEVLSPQDNEICRAGLSFGLNAKSYIPLEVSDMVSMHGFQVAEKLSQKNIHRYFRE